MLEKWTTYLFLIGMTALVLRNPDSARGTIGATGGALRSIYGTFLGGR